MTSPWSVSSGDANGQTMTDETFVTARVPTGKVRGGFPERSTPNQRARVAPRFNQYRNEPKRLSHRSLPRGPVAPQVRTMRDNWPRNAPPQAGGGMPSNRCCRLRISDQAARPPDERSLRTRNDISTIFIVWRKASSMVAAFLTGASAEDGCQYMTQSSSDQTPRNWP